MKSKKLLILLTVLLVITGIFAVLHLNTREEVPENALKITYYEEEILVDAEKLELTQVTGIRVNGKGEEIPVDSSGILIKDILEKKGMKEYKKATVVSDDSYSAEVTYEEIQEPDKVYLLYEEEELRLLVFGDNNSKRSVSNVVQMVIE